MYKAYEKYYILKIEFEYHSYIKYLEEDINNGNINNFETEIIEECKNLSHGYIKFINYYKFDKQTYDNNNNSFFERYFLIQELYGKKYIQLKSLPDIDTVINKIKLYVFDDCINHREIYNVNNFSLNRTVKEKLKFKKDIIDKIYKKISDKIAIEIDERKKDFLEVIEKEVEKKLKESKTIYELHVNLINSGLTGCKLESDVINNSMHTQERSLSYYNLYVDYNNSCIIEVDFDFEKKFTKDTLMKNKYNIRNEKIKNVRVRSYIDE